MSPLAYVLRAPIKAYQYLGAGRPSPCRYVPTCSEYALQAIERRGAVVGLALAAWRLLRCNPWGGRGLDEVPARPSRGMPARVAHLIE